MEYFTTDAIVDSGCWDIERSKAIVFAVEGSRWTGWSTCEWKQTMNSCQLWLLHAAKARQIDYHIQAHAIWWLRCANHYKPLANLPWLILHWPMPQVWNTFKILMLERASFDGCVFFTRFQFTLAIYAISLARSLLINIHEKWRSQEVFHEAAARWEYLQNANSKFC